MKVKSYKNVLAAGIVASTLTLGTLSPAQALNLPWKKAEAASARQNQVQTILIGVDGLSYFAFQAAQRQGLFKDFSNFGAHVAPFPSMTDLSWATITHTADVFGPAGRIKSVEATYFDESSQSIQGDPRDYYRRLAAPKHYMGAFEHFFNPYVEALMYFPTEEVPKLEIKTVVDELIAAKPKPVLTGYVGAIDSTAHTQKDRLFPVMRVLDAELKRLLKAYKDKGQDIEVVLVSDHGNIGRFQEGTPERELLGVDIGPVIERTGLNNVQQLKDAKDVAVPLMALGTWAPVYVKDRKAIQPLIAQFRKEQWFDLAVYINRNSAEDTLMTVVGTLGEAKVQFTKKTGLYYYYPVQGNPLHIASEFHSTQAKPRALTANDIVKATAMSKYPDSIYRLIESASERNFDYPDFILTLKDGYFIKSALGGFTKMYRTHGSLTASSSYGLMASNKRKIPGQIRSKDILPALGIKPADLFGATADAHNKDPQAALNEVRQNQRRGVETKAKDLSQKRIFQHLTRFVSDTRPFFVVGEIKSFMDAFKFDPFQGAAPTTALSPLNFDISKFDVTTMISPEDIGAVTDAVLTSGSVEKLMEDPRIEKLKEKVGGLQDAKAANLDLKNVSLEDDGLLGKFTQFILPAKRAVMKLYQLPYLLEKSIVVQEKPYLTESRDVKFASEWLNRKTGLSKNIKDLTRVSKASGMSPAQVLLQETIKEADLEDRIYPTPLTKLYNSKLSDVTLVYVPGIYNSIFDKEIFSLGLNAVADDMGLRVITPPVESTCASDVNADIIMNYIRDDYRGRLQRGHQPPKYIFLGYSKGAVDTLHAFTKNPSFVSTYVQAFVSIAAPLHGSSILNTTDVPFALVSALSENQGPEVCQKEKTASKSITPTAMDSFWRKNERGLVGLTRYFSVTFESDPEDSHIFMKATKIIGQFDENNDGVVTVSSSKFPSRLKAVDLGTIKADHLAGILASRFNQKAFLKGLVNTLAELDVTNQKNNLDWNSEIILGVANEHYIRDRAYYSIAQPHVAKVTQLGQERLVEHMAFGNSYELNRQVLPAVNDPADNYEVKTKLPSSQLRYDPYAVLDVAKLADVMGDIRVSPATQQNMPEGINIEYNHTNMVHFRMDHQFNYESRTPGGMDDNKETGYVTAEFNGELGWAAMRSKNNSIRLTTLAYRFSPAEFKTMDLKLAVTKGVNGADPVKGKTGKDDSAFQVWFTLRDGKSNGDRTLVDPKNDKVILFGYYWGDAVNGENRVPGTIFENWYSNKNIVVATLPEAKQLLLNDQSMLGKVQQFRRNLLEDIRKAFPGRNADDMEVVAITIQHDSNDSEGSSEAFFKHLKFVP